jgi:hypothetical protein
MRASPLGLSVPLRRSSRGAGCRGPARSQRCLRRCSRPVPATRRARTAPLRSIVCFPAPIPAIGGHDVGQRVRSQCAEVRDQKRHCGCVHRLRQLLPDHIGRRHRGRVLNPQPASQPNPTSMSGACAPSQRTRPEGYEKHRRDSPPSPAPDAGFDDLHICHSACLAQDSGGRGRCRGMVRCSERQGCLRFTGRPRISWLAGTSSIACSRSR